MNDSEYFRLFGLYDVSCNYSTLYSMPTLRPAISLLGIDPREINAYVHQKMYKNIYSSIIHNNSKLKATLMSTKAEWINKWLHSYNRILYTNDKEQTIVTRNDLAKADKHNTERKRQTLRVRTV